MELLFSIISVLLMLPIIKQVEEEEYYRVVFIYLIRYILKSISEPPQRQCLFLRIWSLINIILGFMATALSFGLMSSELRLFLSDVNIYINLALFICVALNVVCDCFEVGTDLIKIRFSRKNIEQDIKVAFEE